MQRDSPSSSVAVEFKMIAYKQCVGVGCVGEGNQKTIVF